MKKGLIGLITAIALSPALANAQSYGMGAGLYLGMSAGKTEVESSTLDNANSLTGVNVDDSDTGFKVFGGTRINPNMAVEVFYNDFGEFSIDTPAASFTSTTEASTVGFAFTGILPVTPDIEVFGKLGMHSWKTDFKSNDGQSNDDDGFDATFGAGVALNIQQITIRAELERYKLDSDDVDMMSVGVAYRF